MSSVCACERACLHSHWPADDQVPFVGPVGQTHARVWQPAGRVDADVAPLVWSHGVDHVEDHLRQHTRTNRQTVMHTHTHGVRSQRRCLIFSSSGSICLLPFPAISSPCRLQSELFNVDCLFRLKFKLIIKSLHSLQSSNRILKHPSSLCTSLSNCSLNCSFNKR